MFEKKSFRAGVIAALVALLVVSNFALFALLSPAAPAAAQQLPVVDHGQSFDLSLPEDGAYYAQAGSMEPCRAGMEKVRTLQTPAPVTPTTAPTANPSAPTATARPATATPRPAPTEDRVKYPEGYETSFKLMAVIDVAAFRQVRVICGNDTAASVKAGQPFEYGSVLVMELWNAKRDQAGAIKDDKGLLIRESLANVFVMRKEKGFGEAYATDRSGEWEYTGYRPSDKQFSTPPQLTNACSACHLTQAGDKVDFVFRTNVFANGNKALQMPQPKENQALIFIYAYGPPTITVKAGTTVTWVNMDESAHTVTAVAKNADGSPIFDSPLLKTILINPQGDSWSYKFDKPGEYEYFCKPHPNMRGKVIVQ